MALLSFYSNIAFCITCFINWNALSSHSVNISCQQSSAAVHRGDCSTFCWWQLCTAVCSGAGRQAGRQKSQHYNRWRCHSLQSAISDSHPKLDRVLVLYSFFFSFFGGAAANHVTGWWKSSYQPRAVHVLTAPVTLAARPRLRALDLNHLHGSVGLKKLILSHFTPASCLPASATSALYTCAA